jgi:hypothetical protein
MVLMKMFRLLIPLGTALALSALALSGTGASAAVGRSAGPTVPTTPTLVGIRAAHHSTFDRVVFVFSGGLPNSHQVGYVDKLIADGSGKPVRIAGRAILQVRLSRATASDSSGPTAPARVAFALPNVMTAVQSGDFEAVTTYGIGLAKRTAFTVSTLTGPPRVVVDVRAAFSTVLKRVWFVNSTNLANDQRPFVSSVLRPVRIHHRAVGVMDRLFAGTLTSERAAGLSLARSKATGFTNLSISGGIARVQLTGGCDRGSSRVSIANEIKPTLRQFASVDFVKIYGPDGTTQHPTGARDSIPACLA